MIGVGIDIIEIERIRKSVDQYKDHFLDRIFTSKEQEYCRRFKDPIFSLSGKFAAKEAVSKALGTGIGEKLSWHDMEILNDEEGRPYLLLSEKANKLFHQPKILLSISHAKEYATAIAMRVS